jgi:hypothetical protein
MKRRAPFSSHLRLITALLHISRTVERLGDRADALNGTRENP